MPEKKEPPSTKPSWTLQQVRERVEKFASDQVETKGSSLASDKRTHVPADFTDQVLAKVDPNTPPEYLGPELEENPYAKLAEVEMRKKDKK